MSKMPFVLATAVCLIASFGLSQVAADSAAKDQSERQAAWSAYQLDLKDSLIRSGSARDLVFAAMLTELLRLSDAVAGEHNLGHANAQELYRSASSKADDDALVHWLLATNSTRDDVQRRSAEALQRLEPNNGMVWLLALSAATRFNDDDGVASAIGHLADSEFFTTHFRDLLLLGLDMVDRFPQLLAANYAADEFAEVRFGTAMTLASAFSAPHYQALVTECGEEKTAGQPERVDDCIAAGRKMFSSSVEALSMSIGNLVLRKLHAPESAENARQVAWYRAAYPMASEALFDEPSAVVVFEEVWRHSPGEIEVYNQLMTRAGLPLVPPDDWTPDTPFIPADKACLDD